MKDNSGFKLLAQTHGPYVKHVSTVKPLMKLMESDMTGRWIFALLLVCLGIPAIANAQPNKYVTRGEMLYSTHCIACHTAKVHWRDDKLAKDWASLNSQVRRWQRNAELKWSDDDIAEVARYLNASHYHFSEPAD